MTAARRNLRRRLFIALIGCATFAIPGHASTTLPVPEIRIHVAAAASTLPAITEAAAIFEKEMAAAASTPTRIVPVFASSGTLARQIVAGSPAQVFITADPRWMDSVEQARLLVPGSRRVIARNALMLVTRKGSGTPVTLAKGAGLPPYLAGKRLVSADPAHAPLGVHARAALEWLGAWKAVEKTLIRTTDAARARILVERGAVDAGILYASDVARNPALQSLAIFPAESHPPSVYEIGLIGSGSFNARPSTPAAGFAQWLNGSKGRAVLQRFGFLPPDGN